jgi:hypothetical protein
LGVDGVFQGGVYLEKPFGEKMKQGLNPLEEQRDREKKEKAKKRSRLNGILLACVFLLSIFLPRAYKAFAPFLLLIPIVWEIVIKMRQSGKIPSDIPHRETHTTPPAPDYASPAEPYYHKPKDPKDPRRYKPIG